MIKAVHTVWIIVSAGMMAVLAASFVLTPESASHILPPCEWQVEFNRACPLCGMTRSFMHVARGELGQALESNGAGPALYILFVMNEIAMGAALAARLTGALGSKRFKDRKGASCRLQA